MTSELQYPFTPEQIQGQSYGNLTAFMLGGIAYAKAQGQDGGAFARFMGQKFSPGWAEISSPREAATAAALNCASAGMSIVSVVGDETSGEAVTSDWPTADFLTLLGLTQEDADHTWEAFGPISQSLGYTYSWRRDGGQLRFTFTK
ncbi:MAG TPA: hypothetical protein VF808_15240 [Ktedonobacterales bacterium]